MGKGADLRHRRQSIWSNVSQTGLLDEGLLLCPSTLHLFSLTFHLLIRPKYKCLVDQNADHDGPENLILQSFFGELQRVVQLNLPRSSELHLSQDETILLAHVQTCDATKNGDGFWEYSSMKRSPHFVDLNTVVCVVGRIRDRGHWTFVDRSGPTAHVKMASPPSSSQCSDVTGFSTSNESDSHSVSSESTGLAPDSLPTNPNDSLMDLGKSSSGSSGQL